MTEEQKERKRINARNYRARHPERCRESRRKCDAKRRQHPDWKPKHSRNHVLEYQKRKAVNNPTEVPETTEQARSSETKHTNTPLCPKTGWPLWAVS